MPSPNSPCTEGLEAGFPNFLQLSRKFYQEILGNMPLLDTAVTDQDGKSEQSKLKEKYTKKKSYI